MSGWSVFGGWFLSLAAYVIFIRFMITPVIHHHNCPTFPRQTRNKNIAERTLLMTMMTDGRQLIFDKIWRKKISKEVLDEIRCVCNLGSWMRCVQFRMSRASLLGARDFGEVCDDDESDENLSIGMNFSVTFAQVENP